MALSKSVLESLTEAESHLRNALAFAARNEKAFVGRNMTLASQVFGEAHLVCDAHAARIRQPRSSFEPVLHAEPLGREGARRPRRPCRRRRSRRQWARCRPGACCPLIRQIRPSVDRDTWQRTSCSTQSVSCVSGPSGLRSRTPSSPRRKQRRRNWTRAGPTGCTTRLILQALFLSRLVSSWATPQSRLQAVHFSDSVDALPTQIVRRQMASR